MPTPESAPAATPGPSSAPASGPRPFAPLALLFSLLACFSAAAIGSLATTPAIDGWYRQLEKPAFTPPDWLFGPVWTVLYLAMALVLWQILKAPADEPGAAARRRGTLLAFAVQLVLNAAWSVVFFGLKTPPAALVVLVLLLAAIVVTWRRARPLVGRWADLLIPYVAWVGYAGLLNASIVALAP